MSADRARRCGWRLSALAGLCLVALVGCYRQQMGDQGRELPYDESPVFEDGRSARPRVPDTVARADVALDALENARTANGYLAQPPLRLTLALVQRGRDRFDAFCSPCHGRVGRGDGMVVQRGFRQPPSYHIPRLQQAAVGYFFEIATKGFGYMPNYNWQIPASDRWAIAVYIKALQLSQAAALADVPPTERQRLEATK